MDEKRNDSKIKKSNALSATREESHPQNLLGETPQHDFLTIISRKYFLKANEINEIGNLEYETFMDLHKYYSKLATEANKKILVKYGVLHQEKLLKQGLHKDTVLQSIYNELNEKKSLSFIITLSFNDQSILYDDINKTIQEFDNINQIFKKCFKWKYLSSSKIHYNFEQRATDENYRGVHSHILIESTTATKFYLKRDFYRAFKQYVAGDNFVRVDVVNGGNPLKYLQGEKSDPDKKLLCLNDIKFREKYNLQNIYKNF